MPLERSTCWRMPRPFQRSTRATRWRPCYGLVQVGVRADERNRMEAMHVYHLTIRENGHSRRFVYEDHDEALTRFADAIAAGLDAKLDEVVRGFRTPSRREHTPMQSLGIANYK